MPSDPPSALLPAAQSDLPVTIPADPNKRRLWRLFVWVTAGFLVSAPIWIYASRRSPSTFSILLKELVVGLAANGLLALLPLCLRRNWRRGIWMTLLAESAFDIGYGCGCAFFYQFRTSGNTPVRVVWFAGLAGLVFLASRLWPRVTMVCASTALLAMIVATIATWPESKMVTLPWSLILTVVTAATVLMWRMRGGKHRARTPVTLVAEAAQSQA